MFILIFMFEKEQAFRGTHLEEAVVEIAFNLALRRIDQLEFRQGLFLLGSIVRVHPLYDKLTAKYVITLIHNFNL